MTGFYCEAAKGSSMFVVVRVELCQRCNSSVKTGVHNKMWTYGGQCLPSPQQRRTPPGLEVGSWLPAAYRTPSGRPAPPESGYLSAACTDTLNNQAQTSLTSLTFSYKLSHLIGLFSFLKGLLLFDRRRLETQTGDSQRFLQQSLQ